MTTAELSKKFTKLTEEFQKIVDKNDAIEAMRWIVSAADFLKECLEEAETMKSLSDYERAAVMEIKTVVSGRGFEMKHVLLERIRKERARIREEKTK